MKFYHRLYVSEGLKEKEKEILEKIKNDKWQYKKYLIVLTENEKNHLEFFDALLLIQKAVSKKTLFVVGLADGYHGALELIQQITEDVYSETQDANIRGYLLQKQQEFEESSV